MAGTTENYGWDFVDSGADPVSGPQNFQHVPQIDATLKSIAGNIVSMQAGTASVNPPATPDDIEQTINFNPPLTGDAVKVLATPHTSVPGGANIHIGVLNETVNSFTLVSYRNNGSTYTVNWLAVGISQA